MLVDGSTRPSLTGSDIVGAGSVGGTGGLRRSAPASAMVPTTATITATITTMLVVRWRWARWTITSISGVTIVAVVDW
jgi:hypothetical protein